MCSCRKGIGSLGRVVDGVSERWVRMREISSGCISLGAGGGEGEGEGGESMSIDDQ